MDFIRQIIVILAAFAFTRLIGKYPNFPIPQEMFINLVLWTISLFGLITYPARIIHQYLIRTIHKMKG